MSADIELEVIEEPLEISLEVQEDDTVISLTLVEDPAPIVTEVNVGQDGSEGLSAYQVAVQEGFVGDEDAWLLSLVGDPGADGLGVPAGGTTGQLLAKVSNTDNDTDWVDPPVATGPALRIAAFDADEELYSPLGWAVRSNGAFQFALSVTPDGESAYADAHQIYHSILPLQDSPDYAVNPFRLDVEIDPDDSGFSVGTSGGALTMQSMSVQALGTGDLGSLSMFSTYFNVGNGTDPIDVNGLAYFFAFGNVNDGVTLTGPIQGFIFQPALADGVIHESYTIPFADFADIDCAVDGYTTFNISPSIAEITTDGNFAGINIAPTLPLFTGNAGFTGIGISPQITTIGTNGFQGISISPQAFNAGAVSVVGLNIYMDNVTGSNVKAMQITGDVSIDGSLAFTGALSIGQLQAFYESNPAQSLDGSPQTLHSLVSGMRALDSTTTTDADAIGVNTAMLITMEDNAIVTSGAFQLGFAAMALPCVVETHTGSNIDYMSAATYAMNFVGSSTGGTVQNLNVGRVVVIPNGITQIDNVRGWIYQEPFGPAGTNRWGFYEEPGVHNFFAGDLKIGTGTDTADAGYKLHIQGGGFLLDDTIVLIDAFDDKIGFFAAPPVVQQASSGAVSAGGAYTATEQTMIQEMYNALRAYGLLT